jgi:uncharacterized membrane protein YuzA (DUF378 family)
MFIVYIILGIASGIIAAAVTLLSGAGVLLAILAYILGGMTGFIAGILWSNAPHQNKAEEHAAAQRS